MSTNQPTELELVLPRGVANPARRALANAGITTIEDLTQISEKDLLKLHGMGPKAVRIMGEELAARGMSFRTSS
ncbi:DNA-directed RNA polymerase subunit alpha C-terminal domain-containing protein [Paenibacillus roseipurpureus]|uniref:DNA-directed RNA polymerase subunit alpha C-terminal domain-containing protein n=1 Tax=Paenibacillus roseopurpureus TaxID=2918901 RepID=A0AA96LL73_9BACL|nr:DNA-directed RNA polymerase subunit alpha C-terminal domain-containing protein [Paenibacillus sp. MBLB1832]WNR42641.1 DNA-directed RNA polymerase subunit alpha C-terminal domain-containing protein [Paenibacillus sp. MBLB1832]